MNCYARHCPEVESYQFSELFILQNILLRRYTIVKIEQLFLSAFKEICLSCFNDFKIHLSVISHWHFKFEGNKWLSLINKLNLRTKFPIFILIIRYYYISFNVCCFNRLDFIWFFFLQNVQNMYNVWENEVNNFRVCLS